MHSSERRDVEQDQLQVYEALIPATFGTRELSCKLDGGARE
jgi:hypothetical protein